jgi:seryl-tRNA synthetase
MIDLKDLRAHPERYRDGARRKHYDVDIDAILADEAAWRETQQRFEALRADQNAASKAIGKIKDPTERQAKIAEVGQLKEQVKAAETEAKALEARFRQAALKVPLPPDEDVPDGKTEADNVVLRHHGAPTAFDFEPLSHIDLAKKHKLANFEAGARLAGSRSYVLTGLGAELHNAVLRLAFDMMVGEHGFTAATVPVLVREDALVGTGFFPDGREDTYHVGDDDLFLVGTGEVGLTALHMNEVLDESQLPLTYATVSTCFRREAGTYGKDTAGFYRVHQFDKCEQVVICEADATMSREWHQKMLGYSEELLQKLELPYRVVDCCAGDIGAKNAARFDIETFMPSRVKDGDPATGYGETHSASRLYDYQARRLNLRYKASDGQTKFCHTLNNTVAASPRLLIPLLENHQQKDGTITVPAALRPYLHGRERIGE